MPKLHEYEIEVKWVGSRPPRFVEAEYGFAGNPPIVVHAKNKREARKKLRLSRNVRIVRITRVE